MTGDFYAPDCQYEHECSSKGDKCKTCRHNKTKRDYYEPAPFRFVPCSPTPAPFKYPQPTITCVVPAVQTW